MDDLPETEALYLLSVEARAQRDFARKLCKLPRDVRKRFCNDMLAKYGGPCSLLQSSPANHSESGMHAHVPPPGSFASFDDADQEDTSPLTPCISCLWQPRRFNAIELDRIFMAHEVSAQHSQRALEDLNPKP